MGRIGHTSFQTYYGHTGRHTRHPSGCLPSGLSSGKPAIFRLSLSIEPIGLSKSSTYFYMKQGNNDFSSFRSYRSWGTTSTKRDNLQGEDEGLSRPTHPTMIISGQRHDLALQFWPQALFWVDFWPRVDFFDFWVNFNQGWLSDLGSHRTEWI